LSSKSSTIRRANGAVADRFRREIEAGRQAGADVGGMTLRLTNTDASRLKRDPAVAVDDIAFAEGVMCFLGVKVVEGGVAESRLDLDGAASS
jgi:hypothetical protein